LRLPMKFLFIVIFSSPLHNAKDQHLGGTSYSPPPHLFSRQKIFIVTSPKFLPLTFSSRRYHSWKLWKHNMKNPGISLWIHRRKLHWHFLKRYDSVDIERISTKKTWVLAKLLYQSSIRTKPQWHFILTKSF
jgi:hypothetical protein